MSEQFDPKELKGAIADVATAFEQFKSANDQRIKEVEGEFHCQGPRDSQKGEAGELGTKRPSRKMVSGSPHGKGRQDCS